jgi:hypothetical protein
VTGFARRAVALAATAALAMALVSAPASPAAAEVDVGADLHVEYDACIAKFTAAGLRDLVDQLDASKHVFRIRRSGGTISNPDSETDAANGKGTGGTTKWNPTDTSPLEGDGVALDPCATLYHEMSHLADYDKGTNRRDPFRYKKDGKEVDTGISNGEVKATRKENQYRRSQKLPERTHYGKSKPLPPEDAEPLPPPEIRPPRGGCSAGCAIGAGDPHLKTFDDRPYDFQMVGEFVLTQAPGGDLAVQGRTSPLNGIRTVSLFSAVAAKVAGDRVGLYRVPAGLTIHIGGSAADVPVGVRKLPRGGEVEPFGSGEVEVRWPDGSALEVAAVGAASLRVTLHLADARRGKVEGIFGNFDGRREGDRVIRGGAAIEETPSFETLYRRFGDSWRVRQDESLFDYAPGQSTETFTDRTFPDKPVAAKDLPNRATAEAICRRAGVSDPTALEDCILDVGLTGEVAFARDAVRTQQLLATSGTTVLSVTQPGGQAQLTFHGVAGQKVFIDVPAVTVPDQCGPLVLRDSAGTTLNSGCIINGTGFVDATVLPRDGEYLLVFKPHRGTGQVSVRVITAVDQELTVTPGGPPITSTISQPGAVTRLRFAGTAGQRVFLGASSSMLPDQCSPLQLRGPNDNYLASGCIINGTGFIEGTVLPVSGQYTILVDPYRAGVGTTQLILVASTDQTGTISVNGPPVTATITQPGSLLRLTFSATAGQRVTLGAESATLPDQCSPLQLRGPGDDFLASGCIINGKGGIHPTTLPVTGTYTITIDPTGAATGTTQLRLHTA